jgi:RNA polymerase sigma-70 factor (sigma-E family)
MQQSGRRKRLDDVLATEALAPESDVDIELDVVSPVTAAHDLHVLTFEEFAVTRGPALVRLARGLLKDPHHAEDLVQDVLAKTLLKWGRISRVDDPDAYVRRMVVNASTSFWRRAVRREYSYEHDRLPEQRVGDRSGDVAARDQMLDLLRQLPPRQRTVLVLRHYEGLADAEIADILGCSQVTVRSNAHRGLASLRALLNEQQDGGR